MIYSSDAPLLPRPPTLWGREGLLWPVEEGRRWMVGPGAVGGCRAAACARVDDGWWMTGADDGWACLPGYARLD